MNAVTKDGYPAAFRVFSKSKPLEFLNALIAAGANVNAATDKGDTLLMRAVQNPDRQCPEVVEALLKAGADPNAALKKDGLTVLMQAVTIKKLDASVITALIKAGANPNAAMGPDESCKK